MLVLVIGLDLLLGASPTAVRVRRGGDTSVRLGEEAHTELTLTWVAATSPARSGMPGRHPPVPAVGCGGSAFPVGSGAASS